MTLSEIKNTNKPMLLPAEVAPVLGCDAHSIRIQARQAPDLLGFPVVVIGNRTLIPRRPFLAYIGEEEKE